MTYLTYFFSSKNTIFCHSTCFYLRLLAACLFLSSACCGIILYTFIFHFFCFLSSIFWLLLLLLLLVLLFVLPWLPFAFSLSARQLRAIALIRGVDKPHVIPSQAARLNYASIYLVRCVLH